MCDHRYHLFVDALNDLMRQCDVMLVHDRDYISVWERANVNAKAFRLEVGGDETYLVASRDLEEQ